MENNTLSLSTPLMNFHSMSISTFPYILFSSSVSWMSTDLTTGFR